MMLQFRKPTMADCDEIAAFKAEFAGQDMDGAGSLHGDTPQAWLDYNRRMEDRSNPRTVPCLQYGLFEDHCLLGLVQIRLELRGYLARCGGHIGYCVRPSRRRQGYAKAMLRLALDVCRQEGLDRVLITCLDKNIASARTIESCGGKLESLVFDNENHRANLRRYWITL